MYRGTVCVLLAAVSTAQVRPQEDPLQTAVKEYDTAHNEGRFSEAALKREIARGLLDRIPADSPHLATSVRSVAQLYQDSGLTVRALAAARQALARATATDSRIQLLETIADFYQQDRNLLQAVAYREKAVIATDEAAAEPVALPDASQPAQAAERGDLPDAGVISVTRVFNAADSPIRMHQQLADLYQKVGRPDAVAALTERMLLIAKKNPFSLAWYYEEHGKLEEAIAIYKEQTHEPAAVLAAQAFESLAIMYQRQRRYAEAADEYGHAIAALDSTGQPVDHAHTTSMRAMMAHLRHLAGQIDAADEAYKKLLAEITAPYLIIEYTSYLSLTKRNDQAMSLLKDYLKSHPDLHPLIQGQLLTALYGTAFRAGDTKLAGEYQRAALEKQKSFFPDPPLISVGKDFQDAETETRAGRFDRGFDLGVRAMSLSSRAVDRVQVNFAVLAIADQFAIQKQPEKAEQLFQHLLRLTEGWSGDDPQPLITALESHSRFLMRQQSGWEKAPAEIKRLRDVIVAAQGATSSTLEKVFQLRSQFERAHGTPQGGIAAAQEFVALNETLAGNSSEAYLNAADELAYRYQSIGDLEHAVPILRRNVAIADLTFLTGDGRRAYFRGKAAMALAQQKNFEEAERLAMEAVAIGKAAQPLDEVTFAAQLLRIRQMRAQAR